MILWKVVLKRSIFFIDFKKWIKSLLIKQRDLLNEEKMQIAQQIFTPTFIKHTKITIWMCLVCSFFVQSYHWNMNVKVIYSIHISILQNGFFIKDGKHMLLTVTMHEVVFQHLFSKHCLFKLWKIWIVAMHPPDWFESIWNDFLVDNLCVKGNVQWFWYLNASMSLIICW